LKTSSIAVDYWKIREEISLICILCEDPQSERIFGETAFSESFLLWTIVGKCHERMFVVMVL